MRMSVALSAIVITLIGGVSMCVSAAEAIDGNVLLRACSLATPDKNDGTQTVTQAVELGYCLGVLEGVRITMMLQKAQLPQGYRICFPEPRGIRNEQAVRIIVKYLNEHPADLHRSPTLLTLLAYRDAYPCS